MKMNKAAAFALATSMISGVAMADQTTTSTATAKTGLAKALQNVSATYVADIYGPSVENANVGKLSDGETSMKVRNSAVAKYKFANGTTLAGVFRFFVPLVREHTATLNDAYMTFAQPKLFSRGSLNLYGDLRLIAPLSSAAIDQNRSMAFASKQILTYGIGKSPITLGLINYVEAGVFTGNGVGKQAGKGNAMVFELNPYVEAQILPTLVGNVSFGMDGKRARNLTGADLPLVQNLGTWLDLGMGWDITPNLNVFPFVEFESPGNGIRAASTTMNASVTWRLL